MTLERNDEKWLEKMRFGSLREKNKTKNKHIVFW